MSTLWLLCLVESARVDARILPQQRLKDCLSRVKHQFILWKHYFYQKLAIDLRIIYYTVCKVF